MLLELYWISLDVGHNLDKLSVAYLVQLSNIGVNRHGEVRFSDS